MSKPRVAFFDLTSCEGCQLQFLNCEQEIPHLLAAVDIVNFREAISERSNDYDVALIEGSVTCDEDIERAKDIRSRAKIVVAFGACASIGGVNCLKNKYPMDELKKTVYGKCAGYYNTLPTKPLDAVIKVDYYIKGCPPSKEEILKVIKALLLGKKPDIPNVPICSECKLAGNVCVFEKDQFCLGPVTLAGCLAICPTNNEGCNGCRGLMKEPNINAEKIILEKYGLTAGEMIAQFNRYNGCTEVIK